MSTNKTIAIGIELGGTVCKLGIFDVDSQELIDMTSSPIKDGKRPGADLFGQFCDAAEELLSVHHLKPEDVVSICVASAGTFGPEDSLCPTEINRITNSPNIPGINDFNIQDALIQRFPHAFTLIENDAKAYGWAEWLWGAGKDPKVRTLLGITLGAVLGGFVLIDGKMIRPWEIQHIKIDYRDDAPFCPCGARGCAEAFISKAAIKRIGSEVLAKFPKSALQEIGKNPEGFDPPSISKAADDGDEGCRYLYDLVGQNLGKLISNLKRICNPDMVIFSGGISNSLHLITPGLQSVLSEDHLIPRQPILRKTELEPGAMGVLGAGALAILSYLEA